MRQLTIFVGLLLAAAPLWAQSRNIHENVDPYNGLRTLFLEVSTRTCAGDRSPGPHDPEVHLLFSAIQNHDGTVGYFVTPELDQASYTLNLRARGTMDTLVDGVPGSLSTPAGSTTTNQYSGGHSYMHETIPFAVTPDDLAKLSTAQTFQFRIDGDKRDVQRCTDAKRMRDLIEFLGAAAVYGPAAAVTDPEPPALPPPAPFVETVDASTHLKKLSLDNIATEPCSNDPADGPKDATVRLAISANQRADGSVWYFLSAQLLHGPLLNLHRGDNIEVQMDGKPSSFHTINGSSMSFVNDGTGKRVPLETIAFHVHQPNLIALSRSSAVEFRIAGQYGSVRRCVHTDELQKLGEFISLAAQYGPGRVDRSATAP